MTTINLSQLQPGDWIITEGHAGWRIWLWPVYWGIRRYSRGKYAGDHASYTGGTHVRLALGYGMLFEMTWPAGRFQTIAAAALEEKAQRGLVRVYRWTQGRIDVRQLHARAGIWIGRQYDLGDLVDFALSGLLGTWNRIVRVAGDRARRFAVCSTAAADVLAAAGVRWADSIESIDPNYPANRPDTGWVRVMVEAKNLSPQQGRIRE